MRTRYYILSLLITLFLFFGCKKEEQEKHYFYLTDEDKEWNIYHLNEEIKFVSNMGNIRTYKVTYIRTGMHEFHIPTDFEDIIYYMEYVFISLNRIDTTEKINIELKRGYPYTSNEFDFWLFWSDFTNGHQIPIQLDETENLTVNNTSYSNVIHLTGNDIINNLYYHKDKGFLRFDYSSGEIFERSN